MKVLFIQVSIVGTSVPRFSEGVGVIAAVLKKNNHKVDLFFLDFNDRDDTSRLKQRILLFKPDVIAFSATTATFRAIKKISKIIKKRFPNIKIVCGGVHVTLCPEDFYRAPFLDAICLGEGEYSFLEFLNKLKRKQDYRHVKGFWVRDKGKIIKNPPRETIKDLDKPPFANRDIFVKEGILSARGRAVFFGKGEEKNLDFIFSRGCPFECNYCANHALKKFYGSNYIRAKSPARAISEIKYVTKKYRGDFFSFLDELFTLDKKWLSSFIDKYKKIKIPFSCCARVGTCTKATFKELKRAGCRGVMMGIESGDEWLRKNVLNRHMTNEQIINTFKWAKEAGLKALAFVMLGFPEETPERFLNTVRLMAQIDPYDYIVFVFYPYHGTRLFEICKQKKLLQKRVREDFTERTDTILNIPTFPRKDILYFYRNIHFLINVSKERKNLIKKIHGKLLFFLLSKPPSSRFFLLYQLLFNIDRSISLFLRSYIGGNT